LFDFPERRVNTENINISHQDADVTTFSTITQTSTTLQQLCGSKFDVLGFELP